jgi:CRP-like cAMP-binding protein
LFKEMQHSVDVLTDTVLCVFERQRFFELYSAHTELAFDVTWLAAREEQMIGDHLVSVGRRSATERIAYILLHLHDRAEMLGQAENGRFALPITQQHLADTLGMSLVHTNKTLKRLLSRELVTWRDGYCTIVDRSALAGIAHYDGDLPRRRRPLI